MTALVPFVQTSDGPCLANAQGQVVPLHEASEDLIASVLDSIKDAESQLREAKSLIGQEVLGRMDRSASWTLHVAGGLKMTAPSPAPVQTWDAEGLRRDLLGLVEAGAISQEACDGAVSEVVTYDLKAHAGGIKALVKLGGVVAQTVARHQSEHERSRSVSLKRAA